MKYSVRDLLRRKGFRYYRGLYVSKDRSTLIKQISDCVLEVNYMDSENNEVVSRCNVCEDFLEINRILSNIKLNYDQI